MWPDWAIFWTLGNFLKPLATINLPKSPTFLCNFCKGVEIFEFSSEIIFRQLLQTFGDFFSGHTACSVVCGWKKPFGSSFRASSSSLNPSQRRLKGRERTVPKIWPFFITPNLSSNSSSSVVVVVKLLWLLKDLLQTCQSMFRHDLVNSNGENLYILSKDKHLGHRVRILSSHLCSAVCYLVHKNHLQYWYRYSKNTTFLLFKSA